MARQRMINPAFFVDEDVAKLSPLARLLFQGLWTLADKRGRLEDRPARIKVQLLPYDECDPEALLAEIDCGGFIIRYESDGRKIIQIRSFSKHQRPHPKEPDTNLPGPPELAVKKHGKPELAGTVCPESESVPSESDTESEFMHGMDGRPVSFPSPSEKAVDLRKSPEEQEKYGQEIWAEFVKRRGKGELPGMSSIEFSLVAKWFQLGIPLRIVLRGIADCSPGKQLPNLKYCGPAVEEAYGMWQRAVSA